jgi:protein phosphatase
MAQKLVEGGELTPERAEESPMAHILWNAVVVGGESELSPEVHRVQLAQGDTLVLCTDGLTKHVDDRDIAAQVARGQPCRQLARALVEAALRGGGSDNVTVVAARFARPDR